MTNVLGYVIYVCCVCVCVCVCVCMYVRVYTVQMEELR